MCGLQWHSGGLQFFYFRQREFGRQHKTINKLGISYEYYEKYIRAARDQL